MTSPPSSPSETTAPDRSAVATAVDPHPDEHPLADATGPEPGELLLGPPEPARSASTSWPEVDWRPSLDLLVAGLLSVFVFALLNWPDPDGWRDLARPLLFLDTTPSGGDMGAHVWGPAYLRDHLLSGGRLTGWTPDWYAGFPAFHFYMVVPALAIVGVNAGLPWWLGLPVAGAVLYGGRSLARLVPTARGWILAAAAFVAVLAVGLPYGVAFKLVSVSGLVLFPISAWAMGRLSGAPRPVPAFLALAAFVFLFDTNFTIYGGNIASTLAGEFAFSISLCLSLLAIGLVVRGMDDQRWRAPAAVVVGLVALCHIIPVFFLVPALALAVMTVVDVPRMWALAAIVAFALVPIAFRDGTSRAIGLLTAVLALAVVLAAMAAEPAVARRGRWLLLVGPTAVLLTGFWLLPFYLREPYFNDMGWERLNAVGEPLLTVPIKIALPMAALGFVIAVAARIRVGVIFGGTGLLFLSAVANLGEGPLWNARLLPFYYLSVYVLAAVGVGMAARQVASIISGDLDRPDRHVLVAATAAATLAVLIAVAMPLRIMPFGRVSDSGDGSYEWLAFTNQARSLVPSWAAWNYSGYEEKPSYGEYHHVVTTMAGVGEDRGCGRAMWEYEKGLDRYGTPMALMLLPHWTDGCIGSMEGLYFESSATTPFHFLNQSVLSESPSRAQRDLPYQGFDIETGVAQLQVMGVRYYLAQSDTAIEAARQHPDLTEVTEAQPFVVFEVAGSSLVQGLAVEPVVAEGRTAEQVAGDQGDPEELTRFDVGWISQAVAYYNDPAAYPSLPAEDGPADWTRQQLLSSGSAIPVEPAVVTDVEVGTDSVAFTVDRVGAPVLVKMSYFPNWDADGADGPWRVGPNLMVVVPTDERVELRYGSTAVDLAGQLLSLLGVAGVVALALMDRGRLIVPDWSAAAARRAAEPPPVDPLGPLGAAGSGNGAAGHGPAEGEAIVTGDDGPAGDEEHDDWSGGDDLGASADPIDEEGHPEGGGPVDEVSADRLGGSAEVDR